MNYYELPVWIQFLFTWEDHLLGELVLLIYLYPLLRGHPLRRHPKKFLPLLLLAPAIAAVNWTAMYVVQGTALMSLTSLLAILGFTFWAVWVWQCTFWQSLSAVCIAGMLQNSLCLTTAHGLDALLSMEMPEAIRSIILLQLVWLTLPIHFALSALLGRLWPDGMVRTFLEHAGRPRQTALLLLLLSMAFVQLHIMQYGIQPKYLPEYLTVTAVLTILVITLLFHLMQRELDQRKLQVQQDIIAQQQLYEQSLEALRQEMRTFRHDQKNLLMAFAGKEAGKELLCSFEALEKGFDQRLEEELQLSAHIGNLCIPQMRSLLLGKLAQMSEKGIKCRLEILYPVNNIWMDIWDLVRCLGILLDNALEAALETEEPWVEILLLQEERTFSLRISNPWTGKIDHAELWKEGWSTKGPDRGMGLFSYQKILQKYPETVSSASWSDGIFVQELTTGGTL